MTKSVMLFSCSLGNIQSFRLKSGSPRMKSAGRIIPPIIPKVKSVDSLWKPRRSAIPSEPIALRTLSKKRNNSSIKPLFTHYYI